MKSKINVIDSLGSGYFCLNNKDAYCYINYTESQYPIIIKWYSDSLIHRKLYDEYYSAIMEEILKKFVIENHHSIQINIISKQNSLTCAINATLLAIIDSGLPISELFFASTNDGDDMYLYVVDNNNFKEIYYHCLFKHRMEFEDKNISLIVENIMYTLNNKFKLF